MIGLALFLLILVLAVPIRYRIRAEKYEAVNGRFQVTWLLHLISVVLKINHNQISLGKVKIAGFTVADFTPLNETEEENSEGAENIEGKLPDGHAQAVITNPSEIADSDGVVDVETLLRDERKAAEKKKESRREKTRREKEQKKKDIQRQKEKEREEKRKKVQAQKEKEKEEKRKKAQEQKEQEKEARRKKKQQERLEKLKKKRVEQKRAAAAKQNGEKKSIQQKVQERFEKCCLMVNQGLDQLDQWIDLTVNRIDQIADKIDSIEDLLTDTVTVRTLHRGWKAVKKMVHHLLPVRGSGNLRIGLAEPAATGQMCGVLAMLMPFYGKHLELIPDFEQQIVEGKVSCRGRIRLGYLVWRVLLLILNRDFWYVVGQLKSLRAEPKETGKQKDR